MTTLSTSTPSVSGERESVGVQPPRDPASPKWPVEDERELLANACRKSFWLFFRLAFWGPNHPGSGWIDPAVHKPLCDKMSEIAERWFAMRAQGPPERHYILIDAARGAGKSTIVTKAFLVWLHLRDPDLAVVIDSVTVSRAEEFMEVIRRLYDGKDGFALFCWLYGLWQGTDLWTKGRFTHRARTLNRSEASFSLCAVETGITGEHPDVLVMDDPITLEKLREEGNWVEIANKHVASLYPALTATSLFIICATPYVDGDVISQAIRHDGIKEHWGHPLPEEYRQYVRPDGRWHVYFMPGATDDDKPLLPTIWPQRDLDDYRRKKPAEYAAQVLLRPGTGEYVPLTIEQLNRMKIARRDAPRFTAYTIHMDTAFKDQKRQGSGDESVIEVWGHAPKGDVYFVEGHGANTWKMNDFTDKLVNLVQRYRAEGKQIRRMTDESIIGGKEGVWKQHLQSCFSNADMWMPPLLEIQRAGKRKIQRIMDAAGYWLDGHVFLIEDAQGLDKLTWQMSRIGISDHDDWADAAADVFHPEIYRPYRGNILDKEPPLPVHPGDAYLQTGVLNAEGARHYYDLETEEQWTEREPV